MKKIVLEIDSKKLKQLARFFCVFLLILAWLFSGWPRLWQKPPVPPEIQKARAQTTDTYTLTQNTNANGYGLWTVPSGVTSANVACWGGGGGGGDGTGTGGGGGGGGAFASSTLTSLVAGTSYTIFIGAGGTLPAAEAGSGGGGGNSTFATTTVVAAGGTGGGGGSGASTTGGPGGTVAASTGTIRSAGGAGAGGVDTGDKGGGGGGAAGPHGAGGDGSGQTGGTGDNTLGGAGGAAGANPGTANPLGGGGGGGGANNLAGGTGGVPGGGGGGGEENYGAATGAGAGGRCEVTYNQPPTLNIDEPDGNGDTVTQGQSYNIQYDLSDPDDTVTAAFYYDTDTDMSGGTAISGACASAGEGTNQTCSWDTTGVTAGNYWVYGVTNDGVNPEVKALSPGQITINAAAATLTLTIDSGDPTSLGTVNAGTPVTATTRLKINTNNSSGYYIIAGRNNSVNEDTLYSAYGNLTIDDSALPVHTTACNSPAAWVTPNSKGLGFSLYAAEGGGKNESCWGTGSSETDSANWYAAFAASASATTILNESDNSPNPSYVSIGYKLDVVVSQTIGPYNDGAVIFTATTN